MQALRQFDVVPCPALADLRQLLAQSRIGQRRLSDLRDHEALALVRTAIRDGDLLVVCAAHATSEAPSEILVLRRLVAQVDRQTRGALSTNGRRYKLVVGDDLAKTADRDHYEVVPKADALAVLDQIARDASAHADLLAKAKEKISKDWRPPFSYPEGLVLLRRIPIRASLPRDNGPAITPSQMKRLLVPEKADIEIRLVEADSGRPLADAPFVLTKPDGTEHRVISSSQGVLRLTDLDPGQCLVTSIVEDATLGASYSADGRGAAATPGAKGDKPPIASAFLVAPEVHRVKSGETPDSIADAEKTPWEVIARFNWETTDSSSLQEVFRDQLGCTKKSPDGREYVFADEDDPGIILIPRPWSASFTVGAVHTVLVSPLRTVYVSLENEAGQRVPGADYEIEFADGNRRQGRLGRSGIARLVGVPNAAFAICYPDDQDVLARSLAASIRSAFDEQATGPLFYMLGQSQDIVDRVVRVYEEHFDDLTGNGLVADIDQVVTDSDARPPLVFLCALAGLNVEGTKDVVIQNGSPGGSGND